MLSKKPWKLEAILRLGLRLFICQILGLLAVAVIQVAVGGAKGGDWLFCLLACGSAFFCAATLFIMRKPWGADALSRQLAFLLAGVSLALVFAGLTQSYVASPDAADPVWRMLTAALCFQGAAILFVGFFIREHDVSWSDSFGFNQQWPRALLFGVLLTLVFLPVGLALQQASASLMTRVDVEPVEQQAVQTLRTADSWLSRAVLAVVAIGLAPVGEEILFRGILYPAVKQAGFRHLALWGSSVLFAVIHGNLATLLPLFVLSVALTLLYEWTNNLLAPIVAHALFNGINFVRLYADQWFSG